MNSLEVRWSFKKKRLNQTLSKSNKTLLSETRSAPFLLPAPLRLPKTAAHPGQLTLNFKLTCGRPKKLPLCSWPILDKVNTRRGHYAPASCSPQQQGPGSPSLEPVLWQRKKHETGPLSESFDRRVAGVHTPDFSLTSYVLLGSRTWQISQRNLYCSHLFLAVHLGSVGYLIAWKC